MWLGLRKHFDIDGNVYRLRNSNRMQLVATKFKLIWYICVLKRFSLDNSKTFLNFILKRFATNLLEFIVYHDCLGLYRFSVSFENALNYHQLSINFKTRRMNLFIIKNLNQSLKIRFFQWLKKTSDQKFYFGVSIC